MKGEIRKRMLKDRDGDYWLILDSGWLYLGKKRRVAKRRLAYLKKHKLIKEAES